MKIQSLHARQILDSRGTPTVEVDCVLEDGSLGRAAVPSGASTGSYEALELRDGDQKRYAGKSVEKAVSNVNGAIATAMKGESVSDHRTVDRRLIDMDGTENKSKLGANAILGVSMAVCRARSASEKRSLWASLAEQFSSAARPSSKGRGEIRMPVPLMNVLNGGAHADNGLSFQEFMIVPVEFSSFAEALRAGAEVFYALKDMLKKFQYVTAVGDEGGFAPQVADADHAFSILVSAIKAAGYEGRVKLAIDAAASEFQTKGTYIVDGRKYTSEKLVSFYGTLCSKYPIVSIEDSHSEDDWKGFAAMQTALGDRVQLVGDDLFVTHTKRLQKGIDEKVANAILIKLNQIGTVSETADAAAIAHKN
ncbi:MAG: phosphopyruvate hydratase, partial [Patescibacteria group bacterium]